VREEKALDLMTALRKMTLMPAQRLEKRGPMFKNKGRIHEGADADITVFDPNRIIDKATYEEPLQYSEGIQFVLVNGVAVVKDGSSSPELFRAERHGAGIEVTHLHSLQDSAEAATESEKTMQSKKAACYIVLRTPFWTGKEPLTLSAADWAAIIGYLLITLVLASTSGAAQGKARKTISCPAAPFPGGWRERRWWRQRLRRIRRWR